MVFEGEVWRQEDKGRLNKFESVNLVAEEQDGSFDFLEIVQKIF